MIARTHPAPLDRHEQRQHKLRNALQSLLLLGGMAGLLALCTWTVTGGEGVPWVVLGGALGLILSPRISPRLVLAMYRAQELAPHQLPSVHEILHEIASRAGLQRAPGLFYVPSPVVNAFTVGRGRESAVVVTDGLLRILDLRELSGVLAHEISHIRNNDLWIMNVADVVARLTRAMAFLGIVILVVAVPFSLSDRIDVPWLLVALLVAAPTLGSLLQLALSRAREFDADLDAAGLTGDPVGLASALEKLERVQGGVWERIFMPHRRRSDPSLLRSHPETQERVRRLLSLYVPEGLPAFRAPASIIVPEVFPPVVGRPRRRLTGIWY
ncbi:MAG: zinc metalloprotease HtpX [Alphaproteobacteria bacterium]